MVVTPADILARCRVIDARIRIASLEVFNAPRDQIDAHFVDAWTERLRRWAVVRDQCGDWASRWWNFKWGPTLDDWTANQVQWERQIELRTKRALPIPPQQKPDEDPTLPQAPSFSADRLLVCGVAAVGLMLVVSGRKR